MCVASLGATIWPWRRTTDRIAEAIERELSSLRSATPNRASTLGDGHGTVDRVRRQRPTSAARRAARRPRISARRMRPSGPSARSASHCSRFRRAESRSWRGGASFVAGGRLTAGVPDAGWDPHHGRASTLRAITRRRILLRRGLRAGRGLRLRAAAPLRHRRAPRQIPRIQHTSVRPRTGPAPVGQLEGGAATRDASSARSQRRKTAGGWSYIGR